MQKFQRSNNAGRWENKTRGQKMEKKKKKKKKKPATRIATNTGTDYERVDWDRKNLSRDEGLDLGVWGVVCKG
jgi:hypothetical protein